MIMVVSCGQTSKNEQSKEKQVSVPIFNADSAYKFTARQVDFGARVPNTKAHDACAAYLAAELKRFGA